MTPPPPLLDRHGATIAECWIAPNGQRCLRFEVQGDVSLDADETARLAAWLQGAMDWQAES